MPNNIVLDRLEAWQAKIIPFLEAQKPQVVGLPRHRLGGHWICDQYRHSDVDYFRALGPLGAFKLVNPSRDRVVEAFSCIDQYGHVALRYHPISEQQAELAQNPVALGVSHAQYWINQLNTTYKEFDRSRICVMGINEPSIHNAAEATRVAVYTESFLKTLQPHGIRAYVFNFSVGWPREENGRIVWDEFLYLEDLINATNSFGCTHEYWYPTVANVWGKYGNRISHCPMKIPFIIGECGFTRQLINPPVGQPWGWDGNISADSYSAMLWDYADKVSPGTVFAVLPFTTSFGGIEWQSKDTSKAHSAILARKHNFAWPSPWPSYVGTEEPPVTDPKLIIYPKYTGKITGYYGQIYKQSYSHEGLDISCPVGQPVYAPTNCTIAWVDEDPATYGKYVRVDTPYDIHFFYAHCSEIFVKRGDVVAQGTMIAKTGNTGNSTGPHLHFEVRARTPENDAYLSGVSLHANGRIDPISFAIGWKTAGNKIEER